jgi:hypothetical protein
MIESGRYASLIELGEVEKVDRSYLCRIPRLTLLAPDIVEAIVDGRQGAMRLAGVMGQFSVRWDQQRHSFRRSGNPPP